MNSTWNFVRARWKKVIGWSLLIAALLLVGLVARGYLEMASVYHADTRRTGDQSAVDVTVGNKTFRVPKNYFVGRHADEGGKQTNLWMSFLLPDLEPYSETNKREFDVAGHGRKIYVMVTEGLPGRNVNQMWLGTRELYVEENMVSEMPPLVTKAYKESLWKRSKQRFLVIGNETVLAMIDCNRPEDYPSPGCEITRDYATDIHFDYRFARSYINDWPEIDKKVFELLRQMEAAAQK